MDYEEERKKEWNIRGNNRD